MFHSRFYQPEQLVQIETENKYNIHPELYLKREIVVDERSFLTQIIYMIQGLQTDLFVKIYDEIEFNSQKQEAQKIYHFSLRKDCRTVFTHLSYQTVLSCSETPIKIANYIHYLTQKSQFIYQNTSNLILKSFSEGLMHYVRGVTAEFTQILIQLQIQAGKISNQSQDTSFTTSATSIQDQTKKLTLLRLSFLFEQKTSLISELVEITSKVLPYILSQGDCSATDHYLIIQILFDQFWHLMKLIELSSEDKKKLLLVFQNSLITYMTFIKNWISMNPYLLDSQKELHFFIKLSQVNFTLSKSSFDRQIYQKLRTDSHLAFNIREQVGKSQEFIELFFKLENLLVEEYLPEIFKKEGLCILQLGKIIQFIYLYFSIQQKPFLAQYFNVEKQFDTFFNLIRKASSEQNSSFNLRQFSKKSIFINNQTGLKKRRIINISQRMNQKKRKPVRNIQIQYDNPYQMFPTTRGIFIDCQSTIADNKFSFNQKQINIKQLQSLDQAQPQYSSFSDSSSLQNFTLMFERTLSQIIQRLYQRALYFFQQHSQKELFKLQSHMIVQSRSLISDDLLTKNLNQQRKNFMHLKSGIHHLRNDQRIISSISLTLIGIKKFMLFEQGDFFLELLSLVNNVFDSSCTKISKNLITSYIQQAIKSSSANNLPQEMKGKVSFLFLKKSKDNQIKQLKVWSVFSILYRPQFPVNCIYNGQIMQSFGEVFNFIFNIKQYEFSLKKIWDQFKQNAKIETQYSLFQTKKHPFESKILAIRNNMHHFINLVFGSVMITIQGLWEEYIQQINLSFMANRLNEIKQKTINLKLHNPISLIKRTQQLLQKLKHQTTQKLILSNTMIIIGSLLAKFKKLLRVQPDSKNWNDVIFGQQIDYISNEFIGVMQMAKNIEDIGESISYNSVI